MYGDKDKYACYNHSYFTDDDMGPVTASSDSYLVYFSNNWSFESISRHVINHSTNIHTRKLSDLRMHHRRVLRN